MSDTLANKVSAVTATARNPLTIAQYFVALSFLVLCAWFGVNLFLDTTEAMREALGTQVRGGDFIVFYTAGRMVREGHYGDLYDRESIGDWIGCVNQGEKDCASFDRNGPGSKTTEFDRFLHPPILAVIFVPFSLLPTETAYRAFVVINLIAALCLWLIMDDLIGSNIWYRVGLVAVLLTFEPLYGSLLQGQLPIFLTLLTCVSLYALLRRRDRTAGFLFGTLIIKPQFLVFIAPVLALHSRRWIRTALVSILIAGAFFLPLGWHGIREFVELLRLRSELDSTDHQFAIHVMSWPGFIAGVINADPPRVVTLLAQGVTALIFGVILWRRDMATLLLGAVLAALIIGPHSHHQDWLLILPGVALLLRSPASSRVRAIDLVLLVSLYVAINDWPRAYRAAELGGSTVYFATLAGTALLLWLAVRPPQTTGSEEDIPAAETREAIGYV